MAIQSAFTKLSIPAHSFVFCSSDPKEESLDLKQEGLNII